MKTEADKYQAIDKAARKEKVTQLIIFSVVAPIMALIYFNLPKETRVLAAITESVGVAQTELGTKGFWVVRLENGGLVRIPIPDSRVFKKGQRVSVVEISSEIGTKEYRLSEIFSEEHNQTLKKDVDKNSVF